MTTPHAATPLRFLRQTNELRVLSVLRTRGASSRTTLAETTGLSRTTLSAITAELLESQAIIEVPVEAEDDARPPGRPPMLLSLNSTAGIAIGVDFGHGRVRAAIANAAHVVLASDVRPHAERTPWTHRVRLAIDLVESLAERDKMTLSALQGIGVGITGPVRAGMKGADLAVSSFSHRFGAPVLVDNNARLAGLAEGTWGAAAGLSDVVYLRLSRGVGAAIILDGRLHRGESGGAGELGHVSIDPAGARCWCGNTGCLESYVSLGSVLAECQAVGATSLQDALDRLSAGDPGVREIFARAGQRIGVVLGAASSILDPKHIVIAGELSLAGDYLLDPLRESLRLSVPGAVFRKLNIRTAKLDESDAARGGIALVLHDPALSPRLYAQQRLRGSDDPAEAAVEEAR